MRARASVAAALFAFSFVLPALGQDAPGPSPPPDTPPPASGPTAASLHAEGTELLANGRVAEACTKLAASVALEKSHLVLSDLARCHELQGRTATAYQEHVEASVLAEKAGDADRATRARDSASRLAPRLSKLRVEVVEPISGLVVKRDGVELAADQLGALLVIDPGLHVVTAEAPGREPFRAEVRIGPDADAKGVLVPKLTKKKGKTLPPIEDPTAKRPEGDGRVGASPVRIAGFVTGGIGFVGVVMGTIFGIQTLIDVGEAEDDQRLCPNKECTPLGRLAIDEAETKGIASTASFAIGGTFLATGITLFLVDAFVLEKKPDEPERAFVVPWAGPTGGGVAAGVSF
ncbi:MAG: hypothetical protein HOV80_26690 [Polyangiaceae bacterium]|nr:hypothetical protein [Polyangiaceae bacterium]